MPLVFHFSIGILNFPSKKSLSPIYFQLKVNSEDLIPSRRNLIKKIVELLLRNHWVLRKSEGPILEMLLIRILNSILTL